MKKEYWSALEWKTEDPSALGIDTEKLSSLDDTICLDYGNITGIVVVKNGAIALERYYHGCGRDDARHVASVTKSVLSALVGIALDEGFLRGTEQRIMEFFPEYRFETGNEVRQAITIRHLLTMTASYPFEDWQEPLERLCMSPDWVGYTLEMLGQGGMPGGFKYSTAGAHLLSAILTRATGKSARQYANERLFAPIGMNVIPAFEMEAFGYDDLFGKNVKGWVSDPAGNSTGGWGLTLTPRDMARFGFLYLNRGIWDGRQIVPARWVEESTFRNANSYGYLWWLFRENGLDAYAAMGDGGNMICCVPAKNLVVAIASDYIQNPRDRWELILKYILPAIAD